MRRAVPRSKRSRLGRRTPTILRRRQRSIPQDQGAFRVRKPLENRNKLSSFIHKLVPLTKHLAHEDSLKENIREQYDKARSIIMNDHVYCESAEDLNDYPRVKITFVIIGDLRAVRVLQIPPTRAQSENQHRLDLCRQNS
ncbi:unnamed protein product [Caenorhabditis brenneri]